MNIDELARICVDTFSREMQIPVTAIHIQKVEEHFVPHAEPGPGEVAITSGTYKVCCIVAVPGARYLITIAKNGRGMVNWKQI